MSNYTSPINNLPISFCTLLFWQCIFFLWHSQLKTLYIIFFLGKNRWKNVFLHLCNLNLSLGFCFFRNLSFAILLSLSFFSNLHATLSRAVDQLVGPSVRWLVADCSKHATYGNWPCSLSNFFIFFFLQSSFHNFSL